MKVAIIGARGFIGRSLARRMAEHGLQVQEYSSTDGTGIDPATGLLPEGFALPRGVRAVVYLAQSPSYQKPQHNWRHLINVNKISALAAAEAALRAGATRFVYASTGSVYAPSFAPCAEDAPKERGNWYALSKLQAEESLALLCDGLDLVLARPFGVYGPGQEGKLVPNLLRAVAEGRPVRLHPRLGQDDDRDGLRTSLTHVDEATEMLQALALGSGPLTVNLAGDTAMSLKEIALVFERVLGRKAQFILSDQARTTDLLADVSRLRAALDPAFIAPAEGLERLAEDFLSSGSAKPRGRGQEPR